MEYDANGIRRTKQIPSGNNAGTTTYVYNGSNLVYEKQELSNKLNCKYFLYNNQGIIGFVYNTTTYMFRKNLFGDITAIYRGNTKVAEYRYDAWGNCLVIDPSTGLANTSVEFIGNQNPFRYRGYYWDNDLGLYYLMSRYYDPQTGRFINADRLEYIAPHIIGGLNLYAYCGNNPVMHTDPLGNAWYDDLWDWVNTIAGFLNPLSKMTALGSVIVAAVSGRWNDVVDDWNNGCLNPFNQSEEIALKSKVVGFYKGSTIVRHNGNGTCSILGTIWAKPGITAKTLKHEYGHSIQERILGPAYLGNIAIPSLLYCWYDSITGPNSINYYSMPWERTADYLGGVDRGNYKDGSLRWAILENILGPIPILMLFYFLFGY